MSHFYANFGRDSEIVGSATTPIRLDAAFLVGTADDIIDAVQRLHNGTQVFNLQTLHSENAAINGNTEIIAMAPNIGECSSCCCCCCCSPLDYSDVWIANYASGSLLTDSDNDDPHGIPDSGRPATPPDLQDQVADQYPGKYIAVQTYNTDRSVVQGTSFVPMQVLVNDFNPGVTKVRFVPQQIDLNGNAQIDTSMFALYSGAAVGNCGASIGLSDGFVVDQFDRHGRL